MRLVPLFGSLPGGSTLLLELLLSVIPLVLLAAGVWFLLRLRCRARETERTGGLARMVEAYEQAEQTDRDDREE